MFEPWLERLCDSPESRPFAFTNQIVFTSSISNTALFAGVKTECPSCRRMRQIYGKPARQFVQVPANDSFRVDDSAGAVRENIREPTELIRARDTRAFDQPPQHRPEVWCLIKRMSSENFRAFYALLCCLGSGCVAVHNICTYRCSFFQNYRACPCFESVSRIFLQDMKYCLRLFSHWVGSRWQRHLSMLNHHEPFIKMPGQRLIFQ